MTHIPSAEENRAGAHEGGAANGRTDGIALWRRVADELERAILLDEFPPGSKLPGEIAIAQRFDVNRHTVRRALRMLAERGLVRAARGSGTFVQPPRLAYPIFKRTRFSEIVGRAGRSADARLVGSAIEPADAALSKRLRLRVGAPLARLDLLRHADGTPICLATSWLSAIRFPDIAAIYAETRSMTKTLARFGIHDYTRRSTRFVASIVEEPDAGRLQLTPGRPLLVIESEDADMCGRPLLATRARFAADRVELKIET